MVSVSPATPTPPPPAPPSKSSQKEVEKDVWQQVVRKKSHGLSPSIGHFASSSSHPPSVVAGAVPSADQTAILAPSTRKNLFSNLEDVGMLAKYDSSHPFLFLFRSFVGFRVSSADKSSSQETFGHDIGYVSRRGSQMISTARLIDLQLRHSVHEL
jgi:hypothetical protein